MEVISVDFANNTNKAVPSTLSGRDIFSVRLRISEWMDGK